VAPDAGNVNQANKRGVTGLSPRLREQVASSTLPCRMNGSLRLRPVTDVEQKTKAEQANSLVRPQEKSCFSSYRARFRPITKTPIRPDPSRIMVAGSGTPVGVAVIDAEYDVEIDAPRETSARRVW